MSLRGFGKAALGEYQLGLLLLIDKIRALPENVTVLINGEIVNAHPSDYLIDFVK
jgi:hypothetical protein